MPPAPSYLHVDLSTPAATQAAGLAQAILRAGKVSSFDELDGQLPDGILLTDEQYDLLERHQAVVSLVRHKVGDCPAGVSIYTCPVCDRWAAISGGSVPATCNLTSHCTGRPVKSTAARKNGQPQTTDAEEEQ